MAIHDSVQSMLRESLPELFLVAKYCIDYQKDFSVWGSTGCYGYPAAILLFSVADSIGSYVMGGNVRKHFNILNHKDYYDLKLNQKEVDLIYKKYRSFLVHNAVMGIDLILSKGRITDPIYEIKDNKSYFNLLPFLEITQKALGKFLENSDMVVGNGKQLIEIIK